MKARAALFLLFAGCVVESGKEVPLVQGSGAVGVDPATQKVTLDANQVPVLAACTAGQIVQRTADGWQCVDRSLPWTSITGVGASTQWPGTVPLARVEGLAGALAAPVDFARLPVGTTAGTVAAGDHGHALPPLPGEVQADAKASCQAIKTEDSDAPSGVYWIDVNGGDNSDAFEVHCDMTTLGGGWTLVMNVNPADGNIVSFTNTRFWRDEAEWGQIGNHFTHDYKSPAAYLLSAGNIMVQVARPGPNGKVFGWKAWGMAAKSFDTFFDAAINTTQTNAVLGSEVTDVYAYEPVIKNGTHLQSNRQIETAPAAGWDRVRLGVDAYSVQGDDNQPGLGTQMNEESCGVGKNCYRFRDVELWVPFTTNYWCTPPTDTTPASYGWIGTDGGCGATCDDCEQNKSPGYFQYWTYRIYVR